MDFDEMLSGPATIEQTFVVEVAKSSELVGNFHNRSCSRALLYDWMPLKILYFSLHA